MSKNSSEGTLKEKRVEPRSTKPKNYRIEIKLVGEPMYQFKVTDVSTTGAGLLINKNSRFLKIIAVGQILDVNFISPQDSNPSGMYKVEIRHITKMDKGRYRGLQRVGILIQESLNPAS
ncbi:MAG: PilZ domain-containing protein [Desulfosarcina sp.]|nr:PilZ domain-containing protein [Desulfobacterales bacterium]